MPLPETSILSAAPRIVEFERAESFRASGEVSLVGKFAEPSWSDLFAARTRTTTVRSFTIRDAYLDTACKLLVKGGAKLRETRYLLSDADYDYAHIIESHIYPLDPRRHYVVGCNRAQHNYYHWIVQAIPAMDWATRHRRDDVTLLVHRMNKWQSEAANLLGLGSIEVEELDVGRHYHLTSVEFSEFLNGTTSFAISRSAASTFQRLRMAAISDSPSNDDIIYVARTDAQNRGAVNEQELIDVLDKEGVRCIVPGSLSVAKQIDLFGKARAVLGGHGAGMTNLVFCQPQTLVYEFMPDMYPNACFAVLAQAAGLHYSADVFPSEGEGDIHSRKTVIDIPRVLQRLKHIRRRLSEGR